MTVLKDQAVAAFQERVRVRLAVLGKSQSDLARDNGLSRQQISAMLQRGPYVNYSTLEKLADMMDTTVSWLVEGELRDAMTDPQLEDPTA